MKPNADPKHGQATGFPVGIEAVQLGDHRLGGGDGGGRELRFLTVFEGPPVGHDRVADEFVQSPLVGEDDLHHGGKVFIELGEKLFWTYLLGK